MKDSPNFCFDPLNRSFNSAIGLRLVFWSESVENRPRKAPLFKSFGAKFPSTISVDLVHGESITSKTKVHPDDGLQDIMATFRG